MAQKMTEERYAEIELLQRYRRDRRLLLEYLCEASSLKKVVMPLGAVTLADVDLDNVSVNYVLEACKSRGTLDLTEAVKQHFKELSMAPSFGAGDSEIFLLATNPKHSGGPPSRPAPEKPGPSYAHLGGAASRSVPGTPSRSSSLKGKASPLRPLTPAEAYEDGVEEFDDLDDEPLAKKQFADNKELVLPLPAFETGLSDDDIRETAYEVLLTAVGDTGALQPPPKVVEEKKKKTLLRRNTSKNRSKTAVPEPVQAHGLTGLLEIIRGQMEIADNADRRTKDALLRAAADRQGRRINTLLVPLELLANVPPSEFASKRDYMRWEKRQLNILVEGLVNQPAVKLSPSNEQLGVKLRQIVARVEEAQMLPGPNGPSQHMEALRDLRAVATALAERSNRGESSDEVIHWADGYPLSVRLYEALLFNIFDMFDPSQLIEEIDEVLELLQSTWRILGVTRAVHDVCLAWVLFKQFVVTGNSDLLSTVASHLKKMVSDGGQSAQERAYMQLMRTVSGEGGKSYSYVQSVLDPIKQWADRRLNDYQREFPNGASGVMESLLSVAMVSGRLLADETETPQGSFISAGRSSAAGERAAMVKQAEGYVRSSLRAAYLRAVRDVEGQPSDDKPTVAVLARLVREIAKEEASNYSPVLVRWNVNAKVVAAATLHELYRGDLKPFLDGVTQLSDDVTAVLPVAEALEAFLMDMTAGADQTDEGAAILESMQPFGVNDMSATLIGRWVNHQLTGLGQMVDRSIAAEQWESLSQTQRYAPSVVELFRIIEVTLDQFYAMKLPMRSSLLRGLTVGFDSALQQYITKLLGQTGDREDLIPPAPALTRYKKDVVTKAEKDALASSLKKRDPRMPDEAREAQIAGLTVTTLGVRLNTLHFILSQLESLENSIRQRWAMKNPHEPLSRGPSRRGSGSEEPRKSPRPRSISTGSNLEDMHGEFFAGTKKAATAAIERLADFLGTKVVFWDLRGKFVDALYKTSVADCRMDKIVTELDAVLSELCEVIAEPLRDRAVLSLLQASLEGLQRVLLDGGPLRAFSAADGELLEEDLTVLKDFFIADGDGLPRTVVENSAAKTAQILHLFELPTDQLTENFQSASREMAGSNGTAHSGTGRSATDADTLLRVLCHRADRDASKFLKKSYKLPKTESR